MITYLLASSHGKKEFSCGYDLLDNYIKTRAKQDQSRRLSTCYVFTDEHSVVKGYYTLSSSSIPRKLLPDAIVKKLPPSYIDLPTVLLGRLAVDKSYQGKRLGEFLLMDALTRSYELSKQVGSMAVIVDPIDEKAVNFYNKYGFILLESGKMFIEMGTIEKLFIE